MRIAESSKEEKIRKMMSYNRGATTQDGASCEAGYGHAKHLKWPGADPEIPNGQRQRTANQFAADQTASHFRRRLAGA